MTGGSEEGAKSVFLRRENFSPSVVVWTDGGEDIEGWTGARRARCILLVVGGGTLAAGFFAGRRPRGGLDCEEVPPPAVLMVKQKQQHSMTWEIAKGDVQSGIQEDR